MWCQLGCDVDVDYPEDQKAAVKLPRVGQCFLDKSLYFDTISRVTKVDKDFIYYKAIKITIRPEEVSIKTSTILEHVGNYRWIHADGRKITNRISKAKYNNMIKSAMQKALAMHREECF